MEQIVKLLPKAMRFGTNVLQKIQQKIKKLNKVDLVAYALGVLSISFRWYKPTIPLYQAMHDDALFVRYASNIMNGKWLGDYVLQGNLTLAKPPGFAIFLAVAHHIPVPFTVVIQILVVLSALSIMTTIRSFGISKEIALFGYATSIFLPIWFGKDASRVYRDSFLAALVIALIAVTLIVFRLYEKRINQNIIFKLCCAIVTLGLIISLVRITKNIEISSYGFVGISIAFLLLKDRKLAFQRRKIIVVAFVLFFLSINTLTVSVEQLNKSNYGVSLTENYTKGEFARALNVIASVKDSSQQRYVPLTKSMRLSIYSVSPTFRLLEPYLELPDGTGWRGQACNSPLKICNETALWFTWELRDAVVMAGKGDSATEFEQFFKKVTEEIVNGCEKKTIACGSRGVAPGIGPISEMSPRHIAESLSGTAIQIYNLAGAGGESATFDPSVEQNTIDLWNSTVHGIPSNSPLDIYAPGINSGSETYELLINVFRPVWQFFCSIGLVGLLVFLLKRKIRYRANLLGITFGGMAGVSILCLQLAISDSEMGLFVKTGTAYYLPMYPFLVLVFTIGANSVIKISSKTQE